MMLGPVGGEGLPVMSRSLLTSGRNTAAYSTMTQRERERSPCLTPCPLGWHFPLA